MRVQLSDRIVNLLEEHVDVAIRVGELPDSSLVAIRVGLIRPVLCASPTYLKERRTPKKPADLASHDCVVYEAYAGGRSWEFRVGGVPQTIDVPWRLMVSSAEAAIVAATAGAGVARVLSYQIEEQLKARVLVKLLEGCEAKPTPVSLIYPSQRQVPLKLRAFLDFSTPRLRERLGYKNP
jgi:DNA-binding transcriptional LysR family regulator